MGVLRCDLRNFNVSVGVTNEFIRPFEPDAEFDETGFAEVCAVATRIT